MTSRRPLLLGVVASLLVVATLAVPRPAPRTVDATPPAARAHRPAPTSHPTKPLPPAPSSDDGPFEVHCAMGLPVGPDAEVFLPAQALGPRDQRRVPLGPGASFSFTVALPSGEGEVWAEGYEPIAIAWTAGNGGTCTVTGPVTPYPVHVHGVVSGGPFEPRTVWVHGCAVKPYVRADGSYDMYLDEGPCRLAAMRKVGNLVSGSPSVWVDGAAGDEIEIDLEGPSDASASIGIQLQAWKSGQWDVGRIDPDSPAEVAGIRPGDRLVAVDGNEVEGMTDTEIGTFLLGEPDTGVTLTLVQDGEEVDVELIREEAR